MERASGEPWPTGFYTHLFWFKLSVSRSLGAPLGGCPFGGKSLVLASSPPPLPFHLPPVPPAKCVQIWGKREASIPTKVESSTEIFLCPPPT